MVKLQQVKDGRSFVNIPKEYIKWKRWKKGTELVLGFNERSNLEIAEGESQPPTVARKRTKRRTNMVKLQQAKDGRSFVNIPKEYVKWKRWKKGAELVLGFNERGNLEIAEVESQPPTGARKRTTRKSKGKGGEEGRIPSTTEAVGTSA